MHLFLQQFLFLTFKVMRHAVVVAAILEDPGLNPHQTLMHILLPSSTFTQNKNLLHSLTDYRVSMYWKWYSKSESTLELQSRVALSVEYLTPNMVPTLEAIPEEGGWIKKRCHLKPPN